MSNVPQDVIDELEKISQDIASVGINGFGNRITDVVSNIRAQRSNAEPVAKIGVDSCGGEPVVEIYCNFPDGIHELYTAPPDYAAGFAAGMMKAAEIAWQETYDQVHAKTGAIAEAATIAHAVKNKILSAIPADSKAALRELLIKVCELRDKHSAKGYIDAAYQVSNEYIADSVLEGKS